MASNCGTSLKMINRHYREVIEDPEEVARFWALTPENIDTAITEVPEVKQRKKVRWPSDKRLMEMVASLPMTQIGKELGVGKHQEERSLSLP